MASPTPHKVFLVTEILENILLETDTRTLLTSAQRVCRKWRCLIQHSTHLQTALFLKPVKYTLPRGVPAIRNPLLADYIWPLFCARYAQGSKAPPVEGGAKMPRIDSEKNERFFRKGASWRHMLFQQPPRSCIGLVEKDGKVLNGPAYTEVHVRLDGNPLRIGDLVYPCGWYGNLIHPLPDDGLLWFGQLHSDEYFKLHPFKTPPYLRRIPQENEEHGEILQSQIAHASSIYLQDCDVVFFTLECSRFRGEHIKSIWDSGTILSHWLHRMNGVLVAGQISIPMYLGRNGSRDIGRACGAIVNVGSGNSLVGINGKVGYTGAKHACAGITKVVGLDHSAEGIRCNMVCPIWVRTPMLDREIANNPKLQHVINAVVPIKRAAEGEDIGDSIAYLLSPAASYVNATTLVLDAATGATLRLA